MYSRAILKQLSGGCDVENAGQDASDWSLAVEVGGYAPMGLDVPGLNLMSRTGSLNGKGRRPVFPLTLKRQRRSSEYKGLELEWTAVCWDLDLVPDGANWAVSAFKGTKWQKVHDLERRQYVINKYRVLLTRAREGMVIWVPEGDKSDWTRDRISGPTML